MPSLKPVVAAVAIALLGAASAWADCTNPTGKESETIYNGDYHTWQFCNGTSWSAMGSVFSVPWATNGTSVYYNGGKVGIGTDSPSNLLDIVNPSTGNTGVGLLQTGVYQWWAGMLSGSAYWSLIPGGSGGTPAVTVTNGGSVGIGTATPIYSLEVKGGSIYDTRSDGSLTRFGLQNSNRHWSISNYGTQFSPNGAFVIADETAGATRLTIDTSGNVGIGTTGPTQKLHVAGNIVAQNQLYDLTSNPQGGTALCRNGSTGVHSECSSDRRLKKDIKYLHAPTLEKIMQLKPATFNWRKGDPTRQIGFIAQDVKSIFPLAVGGDERKQMLTFTPGNLVPYLVKAMQEMGAQFKDQTIEMNKIKADNDNLRADFEAYKKAHP